jgi:uncharacterized repeat protein (TIGR03803 family)
MRQKKSRFMLSGILVVFAVALMLPTGAGAASKYTVLYKFTGRTDGGWAEDNKLIFDAAGNLYGTTRAGGAHSNGAVFELTPNSDGTWSESVLYSFAGGADASSVRAGVTFDASGNLYGTSVFGGDHGEGAVFKLSHNSDGSWSESVIYSFSGGSDGAWAIGGVVFDAAGALYGTTGYGGAQGGGVVFKLTQNSDGSWTESVLHSFTGKDGGYPDHANLVFDSAGNLYGAASDLQWGPCCGTIFELMPQPDGSWKEKVLHHFNGGKDGGTPESTLIFDQAGALYGTAAGGGSTACPRGYTSGCGVVFKLTPNADGTWTEHVLHTFRAGTDGATPLAGVVFDTAGNLYGTTYRGGFGQCSGVFGGPGCGTVFKLTPNSRGGWNETVLHRFHANPNANPFSQLIFDGVGNLYGTSAADGASSSHGGVFEITP